MKKIALLLVGLMLTFGATAQHSEKKKAHRQPDISKMVSDLSSKQKQQLDEITLQSQTELDLLHKQQKALRDSIDALMRTDGDQSAKLFPMFDREANLQAAISRRMYATRTKINSVLTPEQRTQMKEALAKKHADRKARHEQRPEPRKHQPKKTPKQK